MEKRHITELEIQKVKWFDAIEKRLESAEFDRDLYTDIKQAGAFAATVEYIVTGGYRDGRCSCCGQNPCNTFPK